MRKKKGNGEEVKNKKAWIGKREREKRRKDSGVGRLRPFLNEGTAITRKAAPEWATRNLQP